MNIKFYSIQCVIALILFCSCSKNNNCGKFEDFGEILLLPSSDSLFENVHNNTIAIFKDTLGYEVAFNITREDNFYELHQRCDENGNDSITVEDPIEFQYRLQIYKAKYSNDSLFSVTIYLKVWIGGYADSKQDLLNRIADELTISIDDPKPHASTLSGFVDYRNITEIFPSKELHFSNEIAFAGKLFNNVFWDDKHIDVGDGYITYFNKDFGLVGITDKHGKDVLYLDHIE